jgi:hypothetical protein
MVPNIGRQGMEKQKKKQRGIKKLKKRQNKVVGRLL